MIFLKLQTEQEGPIFFCVDYPVFGIILTTNQFGGDFLKHKYSDFGKLVKKQLIEMNQTQEWLITEIKADTRLFIDSSYLNRILTGRNKSEKIINSIKKILSL